MVLNAPLLTGASPVSPLLDECSRVGGDPGDVQAGVWRSDRRNSEIAAIGRSDRVFLHGSSPVIPEVHLGPVVGRPIINVECQSTLNSNDAVLAIAGVGNRPLLHRSARIGPLDDLCAIGGSIGV